ncbi:hypothetical protein ATL39_1366 [Sinobaca qinghaiensis]|jgi:hypothetical protein|uniref:Uncharacterized protein n=1 Tax=Sinobaca qinghaiensis TaxID=342944 RepID=A0A419V6Q1_9BACL|nr:hypothetical protein [Sinobaca qinghaiensis]RKD75665.1 hypothetical protein ATL39_1366 [Sinobaca qinghaiensis]
MAVIDLLSPDEKKKASQLTEKIYQSGSIENDDWKKYTTQLTLLYEKAKNRKL